ncbi:hypothetical protein [Aquisphaera insulae]|uniref:hypothetical protein n=1 Tax=Aquisphaera insulae TaxID=2712864 RepID=UPI0013ED7FBA|nr:hypothetical protein [Aquisphaera insulae]
MDPVMTTDGSASCPDKGTVTLTTKNTKLKAGGGLVLLDGDVSSWKIAGCKQTGSNQTPCVSIQTHGGASTKLKVGGSPVILGSFSGTSEGKPKNTISIGEPGQTKLKSV